MTQCKYLTITNIAGALSVTNIAGPASATTGEIATFIATVTNTEVASGMVEVTFYEAVGETIISTQGTDMIAPGETQDMRVDINTSGWAIGNFSVCAKTAIESTYTQCKDFSITSGTGTLSVTAIIGPPSVTKGETATFIATVTNTEVASGMVEVTFYEAVGGTIISIQETGTIAPGETQDMHVDINTSGWVIGNFSVCAKTASESTYTICKAFEIKAGTLPPPVAEAGMSPILIVGLAVGALVMMMSKKK